MSPKEKIVQFTKKNNRYLLSCLLVVYGSIVVAEETDWSVGGHIKYHFATTHYQSDNLYTQYATQSPVDHFLDLRLTAENRWNMWDTQIHYEVLTIYGDTPKAQQTLTNIRWADATLLPNDNHRLFKLTNEWGNSDKLDAVQRLDRFYLGYNGEQLVIRAGRQIVSWGNGLIFHPLDIFSPFSPIDIDKDYKTGDDMLYGQWLFDNGNDLQVILLPRRNLENNKVESTQSSLATKYHGRYQEWDFDLLAARHYDENVFGFGLNKDILEALWRLDISATQLKESGTTISLVTNIDYSWVWFKRNFYSYMEYFHHSIGETQPANYLDPDIALKIRLQRGEVYTRGRDYLGTGVQIELTPLFNFYTSWIANLHDSSGIFQIRGIYDWFENLQLIGWIDLPYGNKETEFGGISVENSDKYLEPGQKIYIRLSYYF